VLDGSDQRNKQSDVSWKKKDDVDDLSDRLVASV
jgi:hypothetical protein